MSAASVYVHIPFCETKCPYCDFNSFGVEGRDVAGYLDALRRELDARGAPEDPRTVYIGGGTPTVVEPIQLERYLSDLAARIRPDPEREFTVEANPGSLTAEKVEVLRRHGVNRLSIGAQSFHDGHLATLGRVHRAAQVEEAYRAAREGGIREVSLDLIYAVPGMSLRDWAMTLERAIGLAPDHLSCYALTFEPGTEFSAWRAAGRIAPIGEERELAMFRLTERILREAGFRRYEISSFALPGRECKHNLNYWTNGTYVGFGAGAFSYRHGWRLGNERHLGRYAEAVRGRGDAIVFRERLEGLAAAREMMVLGLRTAQGVDPEAVRARYGVDVRREFGEVISALTRGGFLEGERRIRLGRRGWRVADEVASAFL